MKRSWLTQIDFGLLALLFLLSALGLAVLWSASGGAWTHGAGYAARQAKWLILGLAVMAAAARLDYHALETHAAAIYVIHIGMLVMVLAIGKTSMGAQRWLPLGPLRLQPSEFMKIAMAIITAWLLSKQRAAPPYGLTKLFLPICAALLPTALILVQPDLGTAVLVLSVAGVMILFQGVKKKVLLGAAAIAAAAAPLGWSFLREYQKNRILTFFNPERDPLGAGYHIIQSKIAIGSGRMLGKGFLNGTQTHLLFLPEKHTDFIFPVLAEEWGFVGAVFVLALYALLILWGIDIAAKARDSFGRLLAIGTTSIIFFHVIVNVGMTTGLLPVVGVPLPLFSYGGSSVLTTFTVAGILLSIRIRRFAR